MTMQTASRAYTGKSEPDRLDEIKLIAAAQEEVADLGPDLRSAISVVCRYAVDLTGADGAALYLVEGDELVCVTGAGRIEPIVGLRVAAERMFAGRCLTWDDVQACDDAVSDDRVNSEVAQRLGVRSLLCHPVTVGSLRTGVLEVSSTAASAFGTECAGTMRLLAALVTTAFRNAAIVKSRRGTGADPVTGLPDPATYRQRLGLEIERSRRTGSPVGLAIVRLVGYYDGHALTIVANALKGLRSIDEAFLVDGGTFAVIMPDTPMDGALIAARKIAASIGEPLAELDVHVRIGAGQRDDLDADQLHEAALVAAGAVTPETNETPAGETIVL